MLTLWVKLKAGFVISNVVDFLLIVQWIAALVCWRKQKNIAVFAWFDTIIEGQEFSAVIPAVALRKSQPLKLRLVFYSLAERLSMFSAKLNAFENILLVCIFLLYQYVATVAFTSKGFALNHRLYDTDKFIAVRSSPLFLASFWLCPW